MLTNQKERITWVVGVIVVATAMLLLSEWLIPQRSVLMKPRAPASTVAGQGKVTGMIVLDVYSMGSVVDGKTLVTDLEANVSASSDQENLEYEWILPDGVTAPSGVVLHGVLGSLAKGTEAKLSLAVVSDTEKNRQIHVRVFKMKDGEPHGQVAQYNTLEQDKIEAKAQRKAEIVRQLREYGTDFKIME